MTGPGGLVPPGVTPDMLSADFWLERAPDPDAPLIAPEQIATFNAGVYDALALPRGLDLPPVVERGLVAAWAEQVQLPKGEHYGADGHALTAADWSRLVQNAQPDLPANIDVEFGLAVTRTDVRTLPTREPATSAPYQFALDRLQETTVDVGWPVAALATSRDGAWRFCLTPHYWGWLRGGHLALGPRETVAAYADAADFVTVVASRALVAVLERGGVTPQMGTRLPLEEETADAYRVLVPAHDEVGRLRTTTGWLAKDGAECVHGVLTPTLRTVFSQAFRLLAEPYAWGGSRLGIFGRDCSRFVRDVYATMGVLLPRNVAQQAAVCLKVAEFPPDMRERDRVARLVTDVPPGAILTLRGHVMLYLGAVHGMPYAIHDTSSRGYSQVLVSDLSLGAGSAAGALLDRLTGAVVVGFGPGARRPMRAE